MNEDLKVQGAGPADMAKLLAAVVLVLGGIVVFYSLDSLSLWLRWLVVIVGLALGLGALAWSAYGRAMWQFMLDARVELRKVVWPDLRDETLKTTAVVFVFVAVGGVFFWLVDLALAWATRYLTGQG